MMTEFSSAFEVGGKTVQYPLIVPTLTADELRSVRAKNITPEINKKAQQFALNRLSRGQDPFATTQELRYPQPQGLNPTPITGEIRETPRGSVSGFVSDVLDRTMNMPSIPKTGIPGLDLFYANRKPLMNLMGVGDIQKTADRISYGEPLTSGAGGIGGTSRPLPETVGAALTLAPMAKPVTMATLLAAREARKAALAGGRAVAQELGATMLGQRPKSFLGAITPQPMYAVEPNVNQLSTLTRPKAEVSPLGFYSAVEQQALNIPRKQGTGDSFLNDLSKGQDVKKYEIEAMGLDEFLKGKPNVTRQEVQDFIASNRINVQERQLGATVSEDPVGIAQRKAVFDRYEPEIQGLYKEIDQHETNIINARNLASKNETEAIAALNREGNPQPIPTANDWNRYYEAKAEMERVNKIPLDSREYVRKLDALVKARDAEANAAYVVPESIPTKYEKYQLPGGQNYREILLTLPKQSPTTNDIAGKLFGKEMKFLSESEIDAVVAEARRIESTTPKDFASSHFEDPNVLAHMRVNDRIDADGKKMLLIEEVQSDWHQAGREKGYTSPNANKVQQEFADYSNELADKYDVNPAQNIAMYARMKGIKPEEIAKYEELQSTYIKATSGVPNAPFKDTWYQLALKRAIKEAVDKGYDRIGLTTGAQQADRYNLAKQVDEVIAKRNPDGSFNLDATLVGGGSQQSIGKNIPANKLSEYVGSDLAKSMQKQEFGSDVYSGDALKVGGEGMKKYYDEVYPAFLEKQGKKYGAKMGETSIKTETSAPAFVDYVVGRGNFNDTTVLGVKSDGTTVIVNQNANSLQEAQQLANRYKEKHLGGGKEKIRYLDITPEMRKAVKEGQPLAAIQNQLANAMA